MLIQLKNPNWSFIFLASDVTRITPIFSKGGVDSYLMNLKNLYPSILLSSNEFTSIVQFLPIANLPEQESDLHGIPDETILDSIDTMLSDLFTGNGNS
jgi:hypothetical protein